MIQFFRRIRQSLLSDNKYRKYLVYALGEIALVMIGILLALQVNNWNQERQLKKQELELLQDLKKSLLSDLAYEIHPLMERIQLDSTRIAKLLTTTKNAQTTKDPFIMGKYNGVPVLTHEASFNPQGSIYKTLESLGVSLISDKELRNKILSVYDRDYPDIQNWIDNKGINIRDYGRPVIRTKFKELKPEYGFEMLDINIYDDPVFWNYLNNEVRNNRIMFERLVDISAHIEHVVADIQSFLDDL